MPTIKVPPVLRPQTDGEAEVTVEGGTVGDALRALAERYPATKDQLFSPEGELNRYVNVYLNDEDVRVLDGLDTRRLGVGHRGDPACDGGRGAPGSGLSRRTAGTHPQCSRTSPRNCLVRSSFGLLDHLPGRARPRRSRRRP